MTLWSEGSLGDLEEEAPENEEHSDADVRTMESGQGEEGGTVYPTLVEPKTFMVKLRPLNTLEPDEGGAHHGGKKHPTGSRLPLLHRYFCEVIDKGAADKDDRVDTREELGHRRELDAIAEIWGPCSG